MKLLEVAFFEYFYFCFNTKTKIEYHTTPLYLYKASFALYNINSVRDVYYKEPELTDKEDSRPCRDLSSFPSYTGRLKNNKTMGEYRRTYQQKFMQVSKDKSNTKLTKEFKTWKKKAKEKTNDM